MKLLFLIFSVPLNVFAANVHVDPYIPFTRISTGPATFSNSTMTIQDPGRLVNSSKTICQSFWTDDDGVYETLATSVTTNGVGAGAAVFQAIQSTTLKNLAPKKALILARGSGTTETATASIVICLRSIGKANTCNETSGAIVHETTRADTEDMSTYGSGWIPLELSTPTYGFDWSLRTGGFASNNVTAEAYLMGVCW